jgi:hypothetical protein
MDTFPLNHPLLVNERIDDEELKREIEEMSGMLPEVIIRIDEE